jgi:hypothetical protein
MVQFRYIPAMTAPVERRRRREQSRSQPQAPAALLRPAPARTWSLVERGPLMPESRRLFLAALLSARTLEEACAASGVSRGAALAERARDALFALEWDRANDECAAEIETLLIGRIREALATEGDGRGSDAQQRFVIQCAQWLLEARLPGRFGATADPEEEMGAEAAGGAPSAEEIVAEAAGRLAREAAMTPAPGE